MLVPSRHLLLRVSLCDKNHRSNEETLNTISISQVSSTSFKMINILCTVNQTSDFMKLERIVKEIRYSSMNIHVASHMPLLYFFKVQRFIN